tara:strand:+ start:4902 stop:5642 length:741 start_codon:yes stop_codon:yes gene_type:complete
LATKKVRRRRRGSSKRTPTKLYFNQKTQESIIEYQNEESLTKRQQIYVEGILPAFDKLVENLIFIHGFTKSFGAGSYESLKGDCVSFLYESIHKWNPERGTKAFSYFNVVAKNWLIIKTKQKQKSNKRHVNIDNASLCVLDKQTIENYQSIPAPDVIMIGAERSEAIIKMLYEIKRRVNSDNENACIDAIITIFESVDQLDFLNKRALFVYMRDLSSLNPKQLSIAMSSIRKHYRELSGSDAFDIL